MQIIARSTSTHRSTFIPVILCFCSLIAQADEHTPNTPSALGGDEPTTNVVAPTTLPAVEDKQLLAAAQPAPSVQAQVQSSEKEVSVSTEDSPYRLRRALRERDISVGFGQKIPISRFGRRSDITLFQFLPRWGRFRDDRQEFLWEVPITIATEPDTAYAAGLTLMYRYHFSSNRRFAPFVEAGGGFVITNLHTKVKELNGAFQFSPQAGVGVRTALNESSDLILSARWYHLSNAGTRKPNVGLNNYLVTVGYSKLF